MTPVIDLPADLHREDDEGNNLARSRVPRDPTWWRSAPWLVAGSADAWSWDQVLGVDGDWVRIWQITVSGQDDMGPANYDRGP